MRLKQGRALFTSSLRAVCREPLLVEETYVSKNAEEIIQLMQLAEEQGFRIDSTNQDRLAFYPPDKDHPPVFVTRRAIGRGIKNIATSLQRAGLDISSLKNDKPKAPAPGTPRFDQLNTLIGALDEHTAAFVAHVVDHLQDYTEQMAIPLQEVADRSAQERVSGEIEAAQKLALESDELRLASEKELNKALERCQRLQRDYDEMRVKLAEAQERALDSERNLSTIRKALGIKEEG